MTNLHKLIIFWGGVVLAILLAAYLVVATDHTAKTATTTNIVAFNGEGKVLAKPDIAVVSLGILTESENSKQAQDENSAKSKKITDFFKKQGVEEKDIKTTGYNIYPQYAYPKFEKPKISAYQVNQQMDIKIRNLDKVSAILDGVVEAGANQINGFSFQIDNPDKLKAEARAKAIEDARTKADELKDQLGIELGRIINFSENFTGIPGPVYYAKDGFGGGGGGPPLPSGENEVSVSVTLTYQIK